MEKFTKSLDKIVESFERNILEKTLKDTHGNQSKAALLLGLTKRKIQHKISKYGIDFRAIKQEYSAGEHFFNAWHHFSEANIKERQCGGLLLP